MIDLSNPQTQVLLFIPLGALLFYLLSKDDSSSRSVTGSNLVAELETANDKKTGLFIRYNKDSLFSNLLAAEEHLRNVDVEEGDGFLACFVKHMSLSSNHAGELISHEIAVGNTEDSDRYRELNEKIVSLQHDVQDNRVTLQQGIQRTREIRRDFESFNKQFDVSLCKACEIG